jgi:hypothetical protein
MVPHYSEINVQFIYAKYSRPDAGGIYNKLKSLSRRRRNHNIPYVFALKTTVYTQ